MSNVIKVENLGKKYLLNHQGRQESYVALRDVLTDVVKNAGRRLFRGRDLTAGISREEFWALRDVGFEIRAGDRVGIVGRNGAGKSTLLKILSRITEPTTGMVRIKGRVASLLEVGTGFHPELTGRENIFLNGAVLGMSRTEIRKKFDEIVDFAEIEKFLDTPVKRYSSGMYVRLAFSVAAHLEPEILVVDEVLAVGDLQFQQKCLGKMEDVSCREGRTLLLVSHSMESLRKLCNLGLYLEHGATHFFGPIEQCIGSYTGRFFREEQTIVSHCSKESEQVEVTQILVNGSDNDVAIVPAAARSLVVEVQAHLRVAKRVALEVRIIDRHDHVIANFCPSHFASSIEIMPAGLLHLRGVITFPRFTQGDYYLSIFLTDPGKEGYADFPCAVHLIANSEPMTTTGNVLMSSLGHGALILDGEVEYRPGAQ